MCNKFLKLEHITHKKSSCALRMVMSEIGLHSFSTYIQLILSSSLCTRKDWQCLVRVINYGSPEIASLFSLQIASFDHKNDFCKNCIGGFGLFVVTLICV